MNGKVCGQLNEIIKAKTYCLLYEPHGLRIQAMITEEHNDDAWITVSAAMVLQGIVADGYLVTEAFGHLKRECIIR